MEADLARVEQETAFRAIMAESEKRMLDQMAATEARLLGAIQNLVAENTALKSQLVSGGYGVDQPPPPKPVVPEPAVVVPAPAPKAAPKPAAPAPAPALRASSGVGSSTLRESGEVISRKEYDEESGDSLAPPKSQWVAIPGIRSMAGIQVEQSCKDAFNKVRRESTGTRWTIYKFDKRMEWIIPFAEGEETADYRTDWANFLDALPETEACYAIYGFAYVETAGSYGGSVPKSKLTLFTWAPDGAPTKDKMVASSSTAALKGVTKGALDQTIHNKDDCDWENIAQLLGCKGAV
jgi:hypothetical protein